MTRRPSQADLLLPVYHRYSYTRETFAALRRNTDWSRVRSITVHFDHEDGELAEPDFSMLRIEQELRGMPVPIHAYTKRVAGPANVMRHFFQGILDDPAPYVIKVDSDTVVPPHWITPLLQVMDDTAIDLLGMEPVILPPVPYIPGERRHYTTAEFIGGIGALRRRCFDGNPLMASDSPGSLFGWTGWQQHFKQITKGWLTPTLPVILLNRVVTSPWRDLGIQYEARGWQRLWEPYDHTCDAILEWWTPAYPDDAAEHAESLKATYVPRPTRQRRR